MRADALLLKIQQAIEDWRKSHGQHPLTVDEVDRLSSALEDVCDDAVEILSADAPPHPKY
jgi:hypothetical protein